MCDSSCFRVIIPMIYAKFDGEKQGVKNMLYCFAASVVLWSLVILQVNDNCLVEIKPGMS